MKQEESREAIPKRPLLQTKLFMPRGRPDGIARPRLIDRLNSAVSDDGTIHPKLTLITGPAGYGKTTIATQWVSQLSHPVAWLSLDEGDNDIARFMAYLFASIATVQEEIGEAALARLTTTYLYNDPEAILTALLNDFATCAETAVVVLDDYHVINNDAVHQAVAFILQHAPVQLHLVVTSRSEPPLPIALLRARSALNWLTARDLRFTIDETTRFLQRTMNLTLSPTQIEALDSEVEGWVTGLQLAGLALQEGVTLPQATSGNARYLVDYLADQVFDRQPPEVQAFLLKTAVLDRFCISLCDALCEGDSRSLLRYIETANLFLLPLDTERNWYRYHHLFEEFLNGRLHQRHTAEEVAHLHECAARWYHQHHHPLIAVEHALKAGDFPLAAEIIRDVGHEVLMFGEGLTMRGWLEKLPTALQNDDPRMVLFYVWSLIRTGSYKRAKQLLHQISDQLDTPLLWGEWSALRARIAVMTGDTDINIRFSNKALAKLPADQHMLRSEVAINLGFSHLAKSDIEAAREAFAEAAQNRAHDPGLWAMLFATFYWGQTYERELKLNEAYEVYQRGLETALSQQHGRSPSPAVGFMHVGLGKLLYEWNRLGEAETHLRRALACAERSGDHKMLIYARESLARLYVSLDEWEEADSLLNALEAQTRSPGPTIRRAIFAIERGDFETAARWVSHANVSLSDPPDQISEWPLAYTTLVRFHIARRLFDGVLPVLHQLVESANLYKSKRLNIAVLLQKALLFGKQGDIESATQALRHALSDAERGGLVRTFVDSNEPTLTRLLHLIANGAEDNSYARTLLMALGEDTAVDRPLPTLSPRELELLELLAQGLTNRQIGETMVVSLNTVKAHTRRLYGKLDVNSRTQAVARARELRLL